ncbi:MAG TPA: zf-HC2 domain-containing protein [Spirochaetota bacterium]|nr:zf-HC2 domain-containing protein [Spirochaetota bacterium]HPJ42188.1 zf-HC2 domain-containing protein [Spirochaetota bacterium]HPR38870.1 zf-HC2 domain-containing protein [Spirochaetota bacterium]HRX48037.1 zf-HC2 domain-containing protein [Spirochaetota bacterium]
MMFEHLTIEQLSDYIDDSLTEEEKNLVVEHMRICEICRCEYESLNQCVIYMSGLRNEAFQLPDICEKTLLICRSREKKRLYIKSIPAIAASVMIIAVAGAVKTGLYPDNSAYVAANLPAQNETQVIINAIRDSNGRIMSMNSDYIDGEIDNSSLNNLEKYLNRNNIKHKIIPVKYTEAVIKNKNLQNAGLSSIAAPSNEEKKVHIIRNKNSSKITVRFYK